MAVTSGRNYTISHFWSQHKNSSKSAVYSSKSAESGLAGHSGFTIF